MGIGNNEHSFKGAVEELEGAICLNSSPVSLKSSFSFVCATCHWLMGVDIPEPNLINYVLDLVSAISLLFAMYVLVQW